MEIHKDDSISLVTREDYDVEVRIEYPNSGTSFYQYSLYVQGKLIKRTKNSTKDKNLKLNMIQAGRNYQDWGY